MAERPGKMANGRLIKYLSVNVANIAITAAIRYFLFVLNLHAIKL